MPAHRLLGFLLVASLAACSSTPERQFASGDASVEPDTEPTGDVDVDAGPDSDAEPTVDVDCTSKKDGDACGLKEQICLGGECVSTSCGDGYVNTAAGEECEDGNDVDGDGCSACKLDCKSNDDCKDDNPCSENTCDTSTPGKGICSATTAADTTPCSTAEVADGICRGGTCAKKGCGDMIVEGAEECDDGNTDDSDGCRSDCTFTCKTNADCSDEDACNGVETCDVATHTCKAGTPVNCKVSDTCMGTCDKSTGACTYPDFDKDGVGCDKDCNDADPAMFPGAFECKDGKDNDCNPATSDSTAPSCLCYVDSDKDGYAASGASSITSTAANCPDGYTRREPKSTDKTTFDCREGVASAYPGQTAYFSGSYCAGKLIHDFTTGTSTCSLPSWDYDCDGVATKHYPNLASTSGCSRACLSKSLCWCTGEGWTGSTVPACGAAAQFRSCVDSGGVCSPFFTTRTQQCK